MQKAETKKNQPKTGNRKHVVVIIPRGEAVRNFLYSDTLRVLSKKSRVTLLTVVHDQRFVERFQKYVDDIIPLERFVENRIVTYLRHLIHFCHYRWLWSEAAKNMWEIQDTQARSFSKKVRRHFEKLVYRSLAYRPVLEFLSSVERELTWFLRPNDNLQQLLQKLKPDVVFNGSHIHGPAGELPCVVAKRMGIPTVGFIFSWDNLTARSRIFNEYDYYIAWNRQMKRELNELYPNVKEERIRVTGTPQFDFHFKPELFLSRQELAERIGLDPKRPFLLYTTGIAKHFPKEHLTVKLLIDMVKGMELPGRPQLVVRTYIKDTSDEMYSLNQAGDPDVIFPKVLWDKHADTPRFEDQFIYTNLLRHTSCGINAASTVTLELLMHDKPVINLGFDPPNSNLPRYLRYRRHIDFDHFKQVEDSNATVVAKSPEHFKESVIDCLKNPQRRTRERKSLIQKMFPEYLDDGAGERIGSFLLDIANKSKDIEVSEL